MYCTLYKYYIRTKYNGVHKRAVSTFGTSQHILFLSLHFLFIFFINYSLSVTLFFPLTIPCSLDYLLLIHSSL